MNTSTIASICHTVIRFLMDYNAGHNILRLFDV